MGVVSARWIPSLGRATAQPVSRKQQISYWLTMGVLVSVTLAMIIFLINAIVFFSRPFLGVMVTPTQVILASSPTSNVKWEGLARGLRPRDRIIAINRQPLSADPNDYATARASIDRILSNGKIGDIISVTVERPDWGLAYATYALSSVPTEDILIFFLVPWVSGAIALAAAYLILLYRGYVPAALTGAVICALLGLLMAGLFDTTIGGFLTPIWAIAVSMCAGVSIRFGLTFPARMPMLYRFPALSWLPLVGATLVGLVAASFAIAPATPYDFAQTQLVAIGTCLIGGAAMVALQFNQRRFSATRLSRDQSGMMIVSLLLASAPGVLWFASAIVRTINPDYAITTTFEASMPFLLTVVLSVTFILLQERVPDSDVLFSQSLTYGVLMVGVVVGYFLLILGAGLITSEVVPDNPLVIALTLFFMSVFFIPVRARLQHRIDRIYFRQRRQLGDVVEDFGQSLEQLDSADDALKAFVEALHQGVHPSHLLVFLQRSGGGDYVADGTDIRFSPDSPIVMALRSSTAPVVFLPGTPFPLSLVAERARIETLRPAVITTMTTSEQLTGFAILGRPSGRSTYSFEEIRFANALTSQLSVALERSLVVESLEQRLRELNVLSQVGQAANYTNTLDDLLELVSAQTNRLLDADYQYIVFFDAEYEQLYYTFFLEEDERYNDREEARWPLGNDLYSQIIRTGQPRHLEDYARMKQDASFLNLYDSDRIHPFIAVPLIAQTHRLGVFAIGKRDTHPYTMEEFNTFSNLAALAATALEKAQLFEEVNRRARQLGALTEISQKLVAAETADVDALLVLITTSAVTILDAEAGSLLLADDDDSGDMIFRAVIGGASNELMGQRVPAGRGLIGEVTRTGRAQISNQTQNDHRWQGEVVKGNFRTQSILAVPLVAKDRIVGVLEVLNKTDGTAFRDEEVSLLSTFASQAAVAIENARLFAMTGSALNQRLEELQTLELIDRELARALDQREVGRITLKWALQATNAPAAVMGEVNLSNLTMRVLSIEGYTPEEYPAGADGGIWPLHKGIVRRVLRTGIEDLADLRYDPDYSPSLSGAISQMTVPMMSGEEIIALLVMETNRETPFTLIDMEFVKRLAERASIALANAQLYERIVRAAENKSEFVAFAAHELKNPLTSIKGFSDTLLNPRMAAVISNDQRMQFLGVIRSNAERMQAIIDDLRDIAASDAGKLKIAHEPLQFHTVIEDTIAPFAQMLEQKEQTIIQHVPERLPTLYGDHKKLAQVLTNLISNAHKYSPQGTTITLTVDVHSTFRLPNGVELGACMYVGVQDSGIGMSPTDLKRIFREDYFRSDDSRARAQKGTGLGMMITQRIVEGHGGRIWVESELDHGSNFQFVIPIQRFDDGKSSSSSNTGVRKKIVMTSPGQIETPE
jgi:signal transduction histidine kinase